MQRPLRISAEEATACGDADSADAAEAGATDGGAKAVVVETPGSRGAGGSSLWMGFVAAGYFAAGGGGRVTVNGEPPAGSASASMSPPCSRTMDMQMLR